MEVRAESGSYGTSWQLLPYGLHETTQPLDPGTYTLLVQSGRAAKNPAAPQGLVRIFAAPPKPARP